MENESEVSINGWKLTGWPATFAITAVWLLPAAVVFVAMLVR